MHVLWKHWHFHCHQNLTWVVVGYDFDYTPFISGFHQLDAELVLSLQKGRTHHKTGGPWRLHICEIVRPWDFKTVGKKIIRLWRLSTFWPPSSLLTPTHPASPDSELLCNIITCQKELSLLLRLQQFQIQHANSWACYKVAGFFFFQANTQQAWLSTSPAATVNNSSKYKNMSCPFLI